MTGEKPNAAFSKTEEREAAYERIAHIIRKTSEAGKFALRGEVIEALRGQNLTMLTDDRPFEEAVDTVIPEAFLKYEDLKQVAANDGLPRYYSSFFMADAYVNLLLRKEGDPLLLIADTVRENSKIYPRPIPLDTFSHPPFDLSEEEISTCLKNMNKEVSYQDIARTETSAGTIFLYSLLHLDADYASMLAEWIDVGQFNNP